MTDHPSALVSVPVETQECARLLVQELTPDQGQTAGKAFGLAVSLQSMLSAAPAAPQAAGVGEAWEKLPEMDRGFYDHLREIGVLDGYDQIVEWPDIITALRQRDINTEAEIEALRAPSREPEGGAGWSAAIEAAAKTVERQIPDAAGGPMSHTNTARVFMFDAVKAIRALATREEAPANTGECPCNLKADDCHPDCPHGREEAPAEAGAVDEDWIRGLIGEAVVMAEDQERSDESDAEICRISESVLDAIRPYLRAQSQAREDAQPVAWIDPEDLSFLATGNPLTTTLSPRAGEEFPAALYTHPAPDALRVAVEALDEAKAVLNNTAISNALRIVGAYEAVLKALAALQAEQKGGA
jgi:hypothetical protein